MDDACGHQPFGLDFLPARELSGKNKTSIVRVLKFVVVLATDHSVK